MPDYKSLPAPFPHWFGSWGVEDRHGRWWRHSRGHYWFGWGDDGHGERSGCVAVGGEFTTLSKHLRRFGFKVSTTGEETLDVHLCLGPLAQLYGNTTITRAGTKGRQVRLPGVRAILNVGLTGMDWCLGPDDGHHRSRETLRNRLLHSSVTWWRAGWYGGIHEKEAVQDPVMAHVVLPEGRYPVLVELHRHVWRYTLGPWFGPRSARWQDRRKANGKGRFLVRRLVVPALRRVNYVASWEVPSGSGGLPVPGKGENSWDCGPDGLYASGCDVRAPDGPHDKEWVGQAVASATAAVIKTRSRYGRGPEDTGA